MKISRLAISTSYPRGYGENDPRLLVGDVEVRLGAGSWNTVDYKLSASALEQIADIALADYIEHGKDVPLPGVLLFNEADLPPLPETPEAEAETPPATAEATPQPE